MSIIVFMAYFDNLVTRKLQLRDVGGAAGHQITIKNTENTLVGNNQEIILFALKFENDGLETDCQVMVRLLVVSCHAPEPDKRMQQTSALG